MAEITYGLQTQYTSEIIIVGIVLAHTASSFREQLVKQVFGVYRALPQTRWFSSRSLDQYNSLGYN